MMFANPDIQSAKEGPIADQWRELDMARDGILEEARRNANLAGKPYLLPPKGQLPDQPLPQTFQSMGPRGTTNMEGKFVLALFPPDQPWLNLAPAAKYLNDPSIDPADLAALSNRLYANEVALMALLETPRLDRYGRFQRTFRSAKRTAISQILVTGDTLEYLDDMYRLTCFRRDQYVTVRNSSGDVLQHIVQESVDPLNLTEEQFAKTGLSAQELKGKRTPQRMRSLWTNIEWQPWTRMWVISQELNGQTIGVAEETISPYFCTAYELSPGESYGRAWVGLNSGDLASLDNCTRYILDIAGIAASQHPVIDPSSNIKPEDLNTKTGTPLVDSVVNGVPQKVGFLNSARVGEFNILSAVRDALRNDLGKAMLLTSESAPTGEAGRSPYAWQKIAQELDGATAGMYSSINDEQQIPLAQRLIFQATRDKIILPLDQKHFDIRIVTGIAALMRQSKRDRLVGWAQLISSLGPEAAQRVNQEVVIDLLARYDNIAEPNLIKSEKQRAAEINQQVQTEAAIAANTKAIDVAGNVAQAALAPQGTV